MDFPPLQKIITEGLPCSRIYNLRGSSAALFLALIDDHFLAVESNEERAEELFKDINFFREALNKDTVLLLPEPDGPAISGDRAKTIHSLTEPHSLVCSFRNLDRLLWPQESIQDWVVTLRKGMEIDRTSLEMRLQEIGYKSVPLVSAQGEYSRHGWLVDIFPSTSETPKRIEFFGDEIDSIKTFDVDSQRSVEDVPDLILFPAGEPSTGTTILSVMKRASYFFSDSIQEEGVPPNAVFFSKYSIKGPGCDAGLLPIKGLGILPEERKDFEELAINIRIVQKEKRVAVIASSNGQAERLKEILREAGIIAPVIGKKDFLTYGGIISITPADLSSGLHLPGILILTEKEIFGERPGYRPIRKSRVSQLLTSLDDLRPGNFVVHKDHGIGRFHGLVHQSIEGIAEDLLLIEYEGGRLYLPLESINKITRYHSEEGITPRIDRLGGRTWQKTKERAKRKIQDLAVRLISLYAEREVHRGFSFSPDTELHREFNSFFPYEETPDQLGAITDIEKDMESDRPMERLICGDVGYGKTEVAMRAAFKAVYDGTQVAILVPTTILCEQHYRTFRARFTAFPVNIDYLSRFKSLRAQKETLKALANGDIDIVIGTHSLLGRNVIFNKLGLLIVDEEHRFGVRQKEKIKELKKGVDVIMLTATPIPRTLSMALSDIRDMSVIETPPEERLAVKSVVSRFDRELIKEAVEREMARDGQVFFVHNRIRDIHGIKDFLTSLLPASRISVAHGQMEEKTLEKAMLRFYERETDILLSTAIIGSGLDIPSANTIIINRADTMGLADLYQLKGRVGRGNVRAYAYFLVPGEDIITEDAKKRLQAIQEMSYLGAGFRLALKDLEIRGAGNLLGAEQSGHIHAIGFDLYMEMLEKAVAELKGVKIEEEFEPSIRLKVNAFIPEGYIDDITLRLSFYRKIASLRTDETLISLESEIEDRFGKMPEEVNNLIDIVRLKIIARELLIAKVADTNGTITVTFSPDTKVEPKDIFELAKKRDGKIRFLPDGFEINLKGLIWKTVHMNIMNIMKELKESFSLHV